MIRAAVLGSVAGAALRAGMVPRAGAAFRSARPSGQRGCLRRQRCLPPAARPPPGRTQRGPMSVVLWILGILFFLAARLFNNFASAELMTEQGLHVARATHVPFLVAGAACVLLGILFLDALPFRRRLRTRLPRESRLLLPGLLALGIVLVVFVFDKLGEYSRVFVSHAQYWDNYVYFGRYPLRLPTEPFTLGDYLNSTLLLLSGLTAFFLLGALAVLRGPGAPGLPRRESVFWRLLGVGFVYLALDEIFMFHEFIGANLHFDDGRIVLGYLVLMGITGLLFRRKFLSIRAAFACLLIGAFLQALGGVADRFHFWEGGFTPEEVAETSASGFYLLAVLQYACRDLIRFAANSEAGSSQVSRDRPGVRVD
jgi:hypothetical protein